MQEMAQAVPRKGLAKESERSLFEPMFETEQCVTETLTPDEAAALHEALRNLEPPTNALRTAFAKRNRFAQSNPKPNK
jgi:hypothetical protein